MKHYMYTARRIDVAQTGNEIHSNVMAAGMNACLNLFFFSLRSHHMYKYYCTFGSRYETILYLVPSLCMQSTPF